MGLRISKSYLSTYAERGWCCCKSCKTLFIPRYAAYEMLKQWNESDETVITIDCRRKPSKINRAIKTNNCKITQEHTDFLVDLVEKNPVTVSLAREEL